MEKTNKLVVKNPLEHGACPNPLCEWHHKNNLPTSYRWYKSHGFYQTKQHKKIPRYVCINCGRTFTLRTGAKHWHLRDDTIDFRELAVQWSSGGTICEMAKKYGVSTQTIRTRLKRYCDYVKSHWEGGFSVDT